MVYFISDGVFTKIGSTKNVNNRLIELQAGNVRKLSVLRTIEGGIDTERSVQKYFDKYLSRGDWYEIPIPEIISFVYNFNQNSKYSLHLNLLSQIKLTEFDLIDYKVWEYIVGLRKVKFRLTFIEVSMICSRRSYFKTKKKLIKLKLIIKADGKNTYRINTKYIKKRV